MKKNYEGGGAIIADENEENCVTLTTTSILPDGRQSCTDDRRTLGVEKDRCAVAVSRSQRKKHLCGSKAEKGGT